MNVSTPSSLLIVAPTFNNASTLQRVLDSLTTLGRPICVINDGSTDTTADTLATWHGDDHHVLTHAKNAGKAAALASGFAFAREHGFTHVLTIDTDGQHLASDAAKLIEHLEPAAIIVGCRNAKTPGYPRKSRLGRAISNALLWLHAGVRVGDSQCGLRIYPLADASLLHVRTGRYAFETEVLAQAGWRGVPIVEVPIACIYETPEQRVTHFKPWRDSWQAVGMHVRLLAIALWPGPSGRIPNRLLRWFNPLNAFREARHDAFARKSLAGSPALGVLMATLPLYGVKTVTCLALARWLRLQPVLMMAASNLHNPPTGIVLIGGSICVGHLVLQGRWVGLHDFDPRTQGFLNVLKQIAPQWIVGSMIVGTILAALTYAVATLLVRFAYRKSPLPA